MSGKRNSRSSYRIGEAARVLNLKTCVLRFWEGEFPQLAPVRTPKGQRLYTERDMTVLRRIRSLLHEQGMTIEGARRVLAGEMAAPAEGARRVLAGEIIAPAESAEPPAGRPDAASHAPGQGSSVEGAPGGEERAALDGAARDRLLADAVAELKSLRGLLLATPSAPDSSADPSPTPPSSPPVSSLQGPSA